MTSVKQIFTLNQTLTHYTRGNQLRLITMGLQLEQNLLPMLLYSKDTNFEKRY